MQRRVIFLLCTISLLLGCKQTQKKVPILNNKKNYYSNPILTGFYPDPSICKVNEAYYLINSTFSYFPGIPIFKSHDLVNWQQIGNVLDRPEQLNLDKLGVSEGIFAPAISYNNGKFYVVSTLVGGKGNFVVTANNPTGPWSKPVWLPEVNGIDPSLFFDDDGKAYIIYNSTPPLNKSLYNGHRTIRIFEFDQNTLSIIKDTQKILVNGGTDISKKPIWIEGPHIFKENNYYYLIAAEGGTGDNHSEVVFRSRYINGPYESYTNNPILTQRHLDHNRPNPITSVGHADLVKDENGDWWGVFLGCRPYEDNHYNIGRETFMARVVWNNNWPTFDLDGDIVKNKYETPNDIKKLKAYDLNKNFKESFNKQKLGFEWLFLRTPRTAWHSLADGALTIKSRPETISKKENASFIGYRQKHINGNVRLQMSFKAQKEHEKAGIVIFQNENHYYYFCKSIKDNSPVIQLLKSGENGDEELASAVIEDTEKFKLKIDTKGTTYDFYYATKDSKWILLDYDIDAKFLSTKTAGGFVGSIYGLYTTSSGRKSTNSATYYWFENNNNDYN